MASKLSIPLFILICAAAIHVWHQMPEDADLPPASILTASGRGSDYKQLKSQQVSGSSGSLNKPAASGNAGSRRNQNKGSLSTNFTRQSSLQDNQQELRDDFTCKGPDGEEVDWFVAIKEQGTYRYVFATSNNPTFVVNDDITNSGPVYQTLQQTRENHQPERFYSYSSYGSTPGSNQGHQNGVLLFGRRKGFWLIHSWRRMFEHFYGDTFSEVNKGRTKSQSFICTTHSTDTDLQEIKQQLSITNPKRTHGSETFLRGVRQSTEKTSLEFNISGDKLVHYANPKDSTDIYNWIATDNDINGDYQLVVQSWQPIVKDSEIPPIRDIGKHKYRSFSETELTQSYDDHSKWCVPVRRGRGSYRENLKFVCIGDLNRGQTNRAGGAMCLFHPDVWQYFRNICN